MNKYSDPGSGIKHPGSATLVSHIGGTHRCCHLKLAECVELLLAVDAAAQPPLLITIMTDVHRRDWQAEWLMTLAESYSMFSIRQYHRLPMLNLGGATLVR
jgi:hypothetical protein